MINCPNCGAANQDNAKFCTQCGHNLAQAVAGVRCPMCGTVNAPNAGSCVKCNARIKPLVVDSAPEPPAPRPAPSPQETASAPHEPDWLQRLGTGEPEPEQPPTSSVTSLPAEQQDAPDWLQRLQSNVPPGNDSPFDTLETESSSKAEQDVSDSGALHTGPSGLAAAAPADGMADLLASMGTTEPSEPITPELAAPAEDVPDSPALRAGASGLSAMAPAEEAAEPVTPEPAPAAPEPAPSAAAEPTTPEPESTTPVGDVSDLLAAMSSSGQAPVPPTTRPPTDPSASIGADTLGEEPELPDWLAEPGEAELEPAQVPDWLAKPDETELEPAEIPEWLAPPLPISEQVKVDADEGHLAQSDIPAWLEAMRPSVDSIKEPEKVEEVETDGLLAGLAGVVSPASVITAPPTIQRKRRAVRDKAIMSQARLWQDVITKASRPMPISLPKSRLETTRHKIERRVIYLLLALSVILPIGMGVNPLEAESPLTKESGITYELIEDKVSENTPVLVAFDYDPGSLGEVHLQAQAVIEHLIRRKALILTSSLTPEGAALAQQILDDKKYDNFVNLGYMPGQIVGIRALQTIGFQSGRSTFDGQSLEEISLISDLEKLSDVSLIVVLTSQQNHIQWWVEQMALLELSDSIPLVVGVSAAIEPFVRPFYETDPKQVDGLISGVVGASDYELALGLEEGPAGQLLGGQFVGQLMVLALILLGVVVHGLRALRRPA